MKLLYTTILLLTIFGLQAQQIDYNTKKGYVAEGYDVTEYFNNKAIKGDTKYTVIYDQVKYKFANKENLEKFNKNPERFVPEYGGYCAYALGVNGEKVDIDPETFEIRDDKLYLFYNSWGVNTLKKWKREGAEELRQKADDNWNKIKNSK